MLDFLDYCGKNHSIQIQSHFCIVLVMITSDKCLDIFLCPVAYKKILINL